MLAPIVWILVVLGTLAMLACNVLATGGFLAASPRGERAVGLVVPIVIVGAAALIIGLAGVLVAFRAARASTAVVHLGALPSGVLAVVVTFGAALAAAMTFVIWAEPIGEGSWVKFVKPALGWSVGVIGPLVLASVLVIDASQSAGWLKSQPRALLAMRAACAMLALFAVLGYGGVAFMFSQPLRTLATRMTRAVTTSIAGGDGKLPLGASATSILEQELAHTPADAPLADVMHVFVDRNAKGKADCQRLLTSRVVAHPAMREQLVAIMRSKPYDKRWGAAEMIRTAPADVLLANVDAWGEATTAGLLATAEDMATRPQWLTEHFDQNEEPLELVRTLIAAGDRFKQTSHADAIAQAMQQLARDADSLTRGKEWNKLEKELKRAGYQITPQEAAR